MSLGCNNFPPASNQSVDTNNRKRIDSLNNLAWENVRTNISLFRKYGQEALEESISKNYLFGQCESFQILGVYHYYKGTLDSARTFYQLALTKRLEFGDSSMISGTLKQYWSYL